MSATQKNRNPYLTDRPLTRELLKECGNDIELNQRIEIRMGKPLSANKIGYVEGVFNAFDNDFVVLKFSEPVLIKPYDSLLLWTSDSEKKFSYIRVVVRPPLQQIVAPVASTTHQVMLMQEFENIPVLKNIEMDELLAADVISVCKEEVIRVSDKACYMQDEWGVKRYYAPIAETAGIEQNMGEIFDYGWNQSELSFSIMNYDGSFNKFLNGNEKQNWNGRDVKVWFGMGENLNQNILVFEGITHINSGFSENNQVLEVKCYHKSAKFNIPITFERYPYNIMEEDMRGELVPQIYGDYTSQGKHVGRLQRPIVPGTLLNYTIINTFANAKLKRQDLNTAYDFIIRAKNSGTAYNGTTVKVIFSRENDNTTDAASTALSVSGTNPSNYVFTVTLRNGYRTASGTSNRVLRNTPSYLVSVLKSDVRFTDNFEILFESDFANDKTPFKDYNQAVFASRNAGEIKTIQMRTTGGSSTASALYKFCSNPLNEDQSTSKIMFLKGDYDDPAAWEKKFNVITEGEDEESLTLDWSIADGTVLVRNIPSSFFTADDQGDFPITDYKLYAFLRGENINDNFALSNDTSLILNVGNQNEHTVHDRSQEKKKLKFFGNVFKYYEYNSELETNMNANRPFTSVPYFETITPAVPRECKRKWYGKKTCKGGDSAKADETYSFIQYNLSQPMKINFKNDNDKSIYTEFNVEFNHRDITPLLVNVNKTHYTGAPYFETKKYKAPRYATILAFQRTLSESFLSNEFLVRIDSADNKIQLYSPSIGLDEKIDYVVEKDTNYKLIVKHNATNNALEINLIDLDDSSTHTETLTGLPVGLDNGILVDRIKIGTDAFLDPKGEKDNTGYFNFGVVRVVDTLNLEEQDISDHDHNSDWAPFGGKVFIDESPVSIAKRILMMGGADVDDFDGTFDPESNFELASEVIKSRIFLDDDEELCVDKAVEILGQIGYVLTMVNKENRMIFSILKDTIYNYEIGTTRISEYDAEFGTLNSEREVNQYFNTAKAEYNKMPGSDDFINQTVPYIEPLAQKRDSFVYHWFNIRRDDIVKESLEFPNLYDPIQIEKIMKERIANSTPNTEFLTLTLSWRYLLLELGEFVILNHGRFVNTPCQVRSINIDATGTRIEVKLRVLEEMKFYDKSKSTYYTPVNYDGIGGTDAVITKLEE